MQNLSSRPSLPSQAAPPPSASSAAAPSQQRAHTTPKTSKQPRQSTSSLPAPPLDDVHAAFVEFRAKEEDKVRRIFISITQTTACCTSKKTDWFEKYQCLSVQCIYCQQVRAKNTSRQRQHLLECPPYLNVMKDSIPANNLQHSFPEGDIARSLQLPIPTLELDFRMSLKLNPTVTVGQGLWGQRDWVTFVGGQWAGRWGKGIVLVNIVPSFNLLFMEFSLSLLYTNCTQPISSLEDKIRKLLSRSSRLTSRQTTSYKPRMNLRRSSSQRPPAG